MTDEQEKNLRQISKDFSFVNSSYRKRISVFLEPARFINHDCQANARLVVGESRQLFVVATRYTQEDKEITLFYSPDYFGDNNCDCLYITCEEKVAPEERRFLATLYGTKLQALSSGFNVGGGNEEFRLCGAFQYSNKICIAVVNYLR